MPSVRYVVVHGDTALLVEFLDTTTKDPRAFEAKDLHDGHVDALLHFASQLYLEIEKRQAAKSAGRVG